MKYFVLVFCLIACAGVTAQTKGTATKTGMIKEMPTTNTEPAKPATVYTFVEQMPESGYDLRDYMLKNMRYPDEAREKGIEGRVTVTFVVNEDGTINNPKVVRSLGHGCDEEALRLVKNMPPWKPGRQNGKAVKVNFTQPVNFMR